MTILKRPVITEKRTAEAEKFNRYGFIVDDRANKLDIKMAVEEMYGVTVEKVATMNYPGKPRSRTTKSGVITGRKPAIKKAIVYLAKGDVIDFYSNV